MNWLQNPQADYVLAAYGIAAIVLVGALVASWATAQLAARRWRKIRTAYFKGEA